MGPRDERSGTIGKCHYGIAESRKQGSSSSTAFRGCLWWSGEARRPQLAKRKARLPRHFSWRRYWIGIQMLGRPAGNSTKECHVFTWEDEPSQFVRSSFLHSAKRAFQQLSHTLGTIAATNSGVVPLDCLDTVIEDQRSRLVVAAICLQD